MTFAHADHPTENCIDCHHNYNDDTGGGPCMNCHTTNQDVWPLFQRQFHDLCRSCHAEKAALGEEGGRRGIVLSATSATICREWSPPQRVIQALNITNVIARRAACRR